MGLEAINNKWTGYNIFKRNRKLHLDAATSAVLDRLGPHCEMKYVTGLINLRSHHVHLMESSYHEEMARNLNLRSSENAFKHGWYGFSILCKDVGASTLEFLPCGGHSGGIPIKYAPKFEGFMATLFAEKADRILFQQMDYDRQLSADNKKRWTKKLRENNMLWATRSLSNSELNSLMYKL
jgi:hypothetical protein